MFNINPLFPVNSNYILKPAIVDFIGCANPASIFYFSPRPPLRKGDAQFRADSQLPRIRHHAAACVLHQAIAAH